MSAKRNMRPVDVPPVRWVDAPPPMQQRGHGAGADYQWVPMVAGILSTRPDRWAIVREGGGPPGAVSSSFKRYGCEMTSRRRDDGNYDLYARYVGVIDEITDRRQNRDTA